jgi:hypothetical protein
MVSTVASARSALNDRYVRLRERILQHYRTVLDLTGRSVDAKTYKLPPRLGHWNEGHSARVLAACPEMAGTVRAIEAMRAQRDRDLIAAKHIKRKPGGRRVFIHADRQQLNPGYWPPIYKKY